MSAKWRALQHRHRYTYSAIVFPTSFTSSLSQSTLSHSCPKFHSDIHELVSLNSTYAQVNHAKRLVASFGEVLSKTNENNEKEPIFIREAIRFYLEVCEMEPGLFRECDSLVRNMQGRLEILAVSVHAEGDTSMDHYDEHDDMALHTNKPLLPIETETYPVVELSKKMQKQQEMGTGKEEEGEEGKGTKCSTCNTFVGEAKQYREHCKSDWHKHNLKHKTRKLPPLTAEECVVEIDMDDTKADLKDYSF